MKKILAIVLSAAALSSRLRAAALRPPRRATLPAATPIMPPPATTTPPTATPRPATRAENRRVTKPRSKLCFGVFPFLMPPLCKGRWICRRQKDGGIVAF